MRTLSSAAILLLCFACHAMADDQSITSTSDTAAAAEDRESAQVDGQSLVLAYEAEADGEAIREFIPADETLDTWSRLAAVREYSDIDDPKAFAEGVVRLLKERNPPANYEMLENAENGDVVINFIIWPDDASFSEFNVFQYRKKPGGGLISYQYALRAYGDGQEKFISGMDAERRAELIAATLQFAADQNK